MVTYMTLNIQASIKDISFLITKFCNCSCSYVGVVIELNDDLTSLVNIDNNNSMLHDCKLVCLILGKYNTSQSLYFNTKMKKRKDQC
jgi:uncharacterized protein YkvS